MTALDEQIRRELDSRRGEWRGIAQAADVSHSWISQFVRGLIPNPGYATLCRLQAQLWPKAAIKKPAKVEP
jgi:transcriptional regulator with XRE-family HTH domain